MKATLNFLIIVLSLTILSCGNDDQEEQKIELTSENHLYEGDLYAYYLKDRINQINDSIAYYENIGHAENYIGLLRVEKSDKIRELTDQEKRTSTALKNTPKIDLNSFKGLPKPPPTPCDNSIYDNSPIGLVDLNTVNFTKSSDVETLMFELSSIGGVPIKFVINNTSLDATSNLKFIAPRTLGIIDPPCHPKLKVTRLKNNIETSYVIDNLVFIKKD